VNEVASSSRASLTTPRIIGIVGGEKPSDRLLAALSRMVAEMRRDFDMAHGRHRAIAARESR